jgi:hypothetical protein
MIGLAMPALGQEILSKPITIDVQGVTLDYLLSRLQQESDVVFVYGIDNIPQALRVTIKASGKPLLQIINDICRQADLTYQVVDNAIWLKYSPKPQNAKTKAGTGAADTVARQTEILTDSTFRFKESQNRNRDSIPFLYAPPGTLGGPLKVRKPDLKVPVIVESVPAGVGPGPKRIAGYGVFAYYGIDYNQFQFAKRPVLSEAYSVDPNYSIAAGGYVVFRSGIYFSLGIGYATKNFTLSYNYQVLDPSDPFPIPDRTKLRATYVEVPITVGYVFLKRRKFDVCGAAGFYPSVLVSKAESTSYLNSAQKHTDFFIARHESELLSASVGVMLNYRPLERVGVFFEPEYFYIIKRINPAAIESNANMFRLKAGIQISLQK